MKLSAKVIITLLLISSLVANYSPLYGQSLPIIDLVRQGVVYHDEGNYTQAIALYQKALALDSTSTLANYEIAYSYYALKKYSDARQYCLRAMVKGAVEYLPAVLLYGSILDETGNPDEAIRFYKKILKSNPDEYLIHYNLAISYSRIPKPGKAEKHYIEAIYNNLGHASSHLALGELMYSKNRKIESLLPLYFFLVVEPTSDRSKQALDLIFEQLVGDNNQSSDSTIHVSLTTPEIYDQQFGTENMLIRLNSALKDGEDEFGWFHDITKQVFESLAENYMINPGIWRDMYVPVFANLVKSSHFEAFCYYISQSRYETSLDWVHEHPGLTDDMFDFINK